MPDVKDFLIQAAETIGDRARLYDTTDTGVEENFTAIAQVAGLILGKDVLPREVALILHCVKLVRMRGAPEHADNYVDGINYLAFAGAFSNTKRPEQWSTSSPTSSEWSAPSSDFLSEDPSDEPGSKT